MVQAPEVLAVLPPAPLVAPCPTGYRTVVTTGDVVRRLTATEQALAVCAAQVDAMRQWREETARVHGNDGN